MSHDGKSSILLVNHQQSTDWLSTVINTTTTYTSNWTADMQYNKQPSTPTTVTVRVCQGPEYHIIL